MLKYEIINKNHVYNFVDENSISTGYECALRYLISSLLKLIIIFK